MALEDFESNITAMYWEDVIPVMPTVRHPYKNENMAEIVVYIGMEVLIAFVALIDNSMVVAALWRFKSLRTPTNWFVLSLALADIAVAVFAIPSAILLRVGLLITTPDDHSSNITSTVSTVVDSSSSLIDLRDGTASVQLSACLLIICSVIFLTQVSIFGLLLIAIDRFIAINYPFQYHNRMTTCRVKWSIAATWVLGALIGLIPEFGWNKYNAGNPPDDGHGHAHCRFEEVISMKYMVFFNFFVCVLLPLVVMLLLYLLIFRSAKRQLLKIYSDVALKQKVKWPTPRSSLSVTPPLTKKGLRENKHTINRPNIEYTSGYPSPENECRIYERDTSTQNGQFIQAINGISKSSSPVRKLNNGVTTNKLRRISTTTDAQLWRFPKVSQPARHEKERSSSFSLIEEDLLYFKQVPTSRSVFNRDKSFSLKLVLKRQKSEIEKNLLVFKNREDFFNTRPRGKAFSFTTTTPKINSHINKDPFTKKRPTIKRYRPAPKKRRESSPVYGMESKLGSSSSLYMSQYGVWSAVEKPKLTPRMRRRKTEFLKKEFRAARSLATVVGVFAICWLPLHILNCITYFCPDCFHPNWVTDIAIILSHANSTVNPLIYAFKLREFRSAFRSIMKDTLHKTSLRKKRTTTRSAVVLSGFNTTSAMSPTKGNQVYPYDMTSISNVYNTTDSTHYSELSPGYSSRKSSNNNSNISLAHDDDVFYYKKENDLPVIKESNSGINIRQCSGISGLELFLSQETVV